LATFTWLAHRTPQKWRRPLREVSMKTMPQLIGAAPKETFASRGWGEEEWSAAWDRLAARGWVNAAGKATERGRDGRDEIEWRTDRLADAPWRALGPGRAQRLAELTGPVLGAAFESGLLPAQSTLGIATVPAPAPRP
jgi:hypothetical protein